MTGRAEPIWRWASDPPSEKAIRHAEARLGVRFPADYRACIKENGGGAPDPSGFVVPLGPGHTLARAVGILLNLDVQESENVLGTVDELDVRDERPEGLVPIINDGEGNYVCLDYRDDPAKVAPKVAFLGRKGEAAGVVAPLAGTFSDFLALLA